MKRSRRKNPKIPDSTYAKTLIFDPPSSAKRAASGKRSKNTVPSNVPAAKADKK